MTSLRQRVAHANERSTTQQDEAALGLRQLDDMQRDPFVGCHLGDGLAGVALIDVGELYLLADCILPKVTKRFLEPLRALPSVSRIAGLRALHRADVDWMVNTEAVRIADGRIVLRNHITEVEESLPVDGAIWVGRQRPGDELGAALKSENASVFVVGSANAPQRLRDAINSGRRAAHA